MNHIIEYIGHGQVIHSPPQFFAVRLQSPAAGDLIDFGDFAGTFPFTHGQLGRIEGVGTGFANENEAHVCCELGSAFLSIGQRERINVSISGGPFCCIPLDHLEPMMYVHPARFWNWGNNSSGAGMGVSYTIERPVFKLTKWDR